ncbi:hypothetical protein FW778_20995 [Ginsengibacter hankyongi]|uniref:Uncharacterized protein n=1 Tax=Ginsengibacter hankyongi TaxID=2607284 RepID=A0A5J5ICR9_9BACT|nr:hypothetical protein [Ginsengibacter hankyongi]KAA9035704.1 hypothetical protein FW778_20995 [Ginsengibacter hankyongi]
MDKGSVYAKLNTFITTLQQQAYAYIRKIINIHRQSFMPSAKMSSDFKRIGWNSIMMAWVQTDVGDAGLQNHQHEHTTSAASLSVCNALNLERRKTNGG